MELDGAISRRGGLARVAACIGVAITLVAMPRISTTAEIPSSEEFEDALPSGAHLSAREIFERFLNNRMKAAYQEVRVVSADPGGSAQETSFNIHAQDARDEHDEPINGILARTLIEVTDPFDMRHTAYLMIAKDPGPDDQFVYRPGARKVTRVNLRHTTLLGTDFTFDDLGFHEIDDADYHRRPDEIIEGRQVYVIEAIMKDKSRSDYGKTLSYLETDHYVPLRTRYWDHANVESKELIAKFASISQYGDVWVARESKMTNHLENTHSILHVVDLEPDPKIETNLFSLHRLARGR